MSEKDTITAYYAGGIEQDRLELDHFALEGIRSKDIIARHLQGGKLKILDIGGGAGFYAFWLQEMGHEVTLVDLSPHNIELAEKRSSETGLKLNSMSVGDATQLDHDSDQFDMVLMLGPLYHLTNSSDRIGSLREAARVLKPGGKLLAAVISRYASLFDGYKRGLVADPLFAGQLVADIHTGIHENKTGNPEHFTTAYFHTPEEIKNEIRSGGLKFEKIIAIESFSWIIDEFSSKRNDNAYMQTLLKHIHLIEGNEDIVAMSPHMMAIANK